MFTFSWDFLKEPNLLRVQLMCELKQPASLEYGNRQKHKEDSRQTVELQNFYGNWALTHSDELFKCIKFDMSCSNICHLRFIGVEYKSTETHWFQFSFSNSVPCICLVNVVIFFFFCRNICSSRNKCNAFTIHFKFDVQMLNSFFYPSMHFVIYSFWFKYSSRGNCNARISNASCVQQPTQSVSRRTWKRDRERIFFSDLHAHIL